MRALSSREIAACLALIDHPPESLPVLAMLLNVPHNETDWDRWSFANYDALNQIRAAIAAQQGVSLPSYQVWPIDFGDLDNFLDANQQAHNDFNGTLGLNGNDLLHVDLREANQLQSWVYLNYMEVSAACSTLKIGP